jgi:hypothetical protein
MGKFTIYKKDRLENLIKDINTHVDELYKIFPLDLDEQERLGKAELEEFIHILRLVWTISEHDQLLNSAV